MDNKGFSLGTVRILSDAERDNFIELLLKNGFVAINTTLSYTSYKYTRNDWLFVRAYKDCYQVHLIGDYDTYILKKNKYDLKSQQKEGFFKNNILDNVS